MFSKQLAANFREWPEAALTGALLALAFGVVVLALWPGHAIAKAIVLAWLVFP